MNHINFTEKQNINGKDGNSCKYNITFNRLVQIWNRLKYDVCFVKF